MQPHSPQPHSQSPARRAPAASPACGSVWVSSRSWSHPSTYLNLNQAGQTASQNIFKATGMGRVSGWRLGGTGGPGSREQQARGGTGNATERKRNRENPRELVKHRLQESSRTGLRFGQGLSPAQPWCPAWIQQDLSSPGVPFPAPARLQPDPEPPAAPARAVPAQPPGRLLVPKNLWLSQHPALLARAQWPQAVPRNCPPSQRSCSGWGCKGQQIEKNKRTAGGGFPFLWTAGLFLPPPASSCPSKTATEFILTTRETRLREKCRFVGTAP